MATKGVSARLVMVLVLCGGLPTASAGTQPAWAQRDDRPGARVQPPTELLKEYPFHQGRLFNHERSDGDEPASTAERPGGEPSSEGIAWEIVTPAILGARLFLLLGGMVVRAARGPTGRSGKEAPPPSRPPF
jgi:hypothetical protein